MCGDGYKRLHTCNNILFWIFSSYFISSLLLNWISFSRWKRKLHYVDNIFTIFFSKKNNKFRRFCSPPVRIQSSLNSKLILTGPPIFDENSPHKTRKANDKAWHQWIEIWFQGFYFCLHLLAFFIDLVTEYSKSWNW